MSHEEQERQGTGLRDVFDILLKACSERLLSLTFQLGESPEDDLIHVLCLIILQREEQVLNKLQMLKDNGLAKQLAESWRMSGGKLEDFRDHCGDLQEFTGESLAMLARVFKVLSERSLCDQHLRNLAYQRAVSVDSQKTSSCEGLEYDKLREEAKNVCGPQFEEWMCSSRDLQSGSLPDPHRSLDETLKITNRSERGYSLASPLEASSSMPSYPTHLEISISPTALFEADKISPEAFDQPQLNICLLARGQSHSSEEPKSNEPAPLETKKDSKMHTPLPAQCRKLDIQIPPPIPTTKPSSLPNCELPTAANACVPKVPVRDDMHEREAAEKNKAIFYAFVILHSPEDEDVAESMRERMETVTGCVGATFSEEFAVPGRSALRCVEDAINNSAFTLLLLTRNFNTRMLETETDTALINSINNKYKHNTVIPLLPRENSLPRESMPMVLKTIVALEDNRNFDKKVQKSLCQANVKRQKKIWEEEQRMKSQMERQEELKRLNQYQKKLIQQCKESQSLEQDNMSLLMTQKLLLGSSEQEGGAGSARCQQHPNIHIENAQYIMIGNDSQMTVDHLGDAVKDDTIYSENKQ
ncbi:TIR domain-containing adapter molecule 1 isoform X1 [Hippoglossus hippoglossus]|uniref:TIR domain-containing adapter molecule 1 isoform X1 n=1 Tax=Hippoglossus hippoglossus TaxID=8267 RepID=UPI00148DBCFE|nr:TIR domain-containing adapter molecule 1 isoform X1 [Hippoglossus hippoglossus]